MLAGRVEIGEAAGRGLMLALARKAAVGDMSGAIAHELASVMQSLYGAFAAIDATITDEQREDEEVREAIEDLEYACGHVVGLYRALRSMLHGDSVARQPVDAGDVVGKALRVCSGAARGRSELRFEPPAERVAVAGNRVLLQQVLVCAVRSLLSDRSRGLPVTVTVTPEGERVAVRVRGDGAELPTAVRPLEEFDGLDPANGDHLEGPDFALACAAFLVERMEGSLSLGDNEIALELGRFRD